MVADFFFGGGGLRREAESSFRESWSWVLGGGVSKQGSGGDSRITATHSWKGTRGCDWLAAAVLAVCLCPGAGAAAWRRCFEKNAR